MTKKFLDNTGLSHLIDKIQQMPDNETIGYNTTDGLHLLDGSITEDKIEKNFYNTIINSGGGSAPGALFSSAAGRAERKAINFYYTKNTGYYTGAKSSGSSGNDFTKDLMRKTQGIVINDDLSIEFWFQGGSKNDSDVNQNNKRIYVRKYTISSDGVVSYNRYSFSVTSSLSYRSIGYEDGWFCVFKKENGSRLIHARIDCNNSNYGYDDMIATITSDGVMSGTLSNNPGSSNYSFRYFSDPIELDNGSQVVFGGVAQSDEYADVKKIVITSDGVKSILSFGGLSSTEWVAWGQVPQLKKLGNYIFIACYNSTLRTPANSTSTSKTDAGPLFLSYIRYRNYLVENDIEIEESFTGTTFTDSMYLMNNGLTLSKATDVGTGNTLINFYNNTIGTSNSLDTWSSMDKPYFVVLKDSNDVYHVYNFNYNIWYDTSNEFYLADTIPSVEVTATNLNGETTLISSSSGIEDSIIEDPYNEFLHDGGSTMLKKLSDGRILMIKRFQTEYYVSDTLTMYYWCPNIAVAIIPKLP